MKCVHHFFLLNRKWNVPTNFDKFLMSNFMKIRSLSRGLMHADTRVVFNKRLPGTCERTKSARLRASWLVEGTFSGLVM